MDSSKDKEYMVFEPFIFRIPFFCIEQPNKEDIPVILSDLQFLEALYLASPVLYSEVGCFKNGKLKQEELLKFQVSVYKYYLRMCSRCTPFGLFAGCGIGKIGEKSKILPAPSDKYKSSTRLDMDFLGALIQNISKGVQLKEQLEYFPNTSLYQSGKNLRYTEYSYSKTRRKYVITEAESTSYLAEVLDKATCGASVTELAGLLVDEEITLDEAKEYIEELVDSQLLISELEPSVTGEDMLQQLLKKLRRTEGTNGIQTRLECVAENLKDIDQLPVGRPVKIYEEIKKKIEKFDTKFDEKFLFQLDLFIESEHASLGTQIISVAQKGISALNRLSAKYENPVLKKFREDFCKKYEDEEIPLLQALDVETGVGFGNIDGQRGDINPLLEGIQFPGGHPVAQDIKIDMVQAILMKKYDEYLGNPDQKEIVINDEDLKDLKENWDDLPDTVSAMIEVIRTEECPDGPLVSMSQAGGSSAANLLCRFCHIDEKINSFVEQIVKKEQELNPDKILAEIVHLPESRLGNILMRPSFRKYEIPYLANTSVDNERVIPVADLMVAVPQGKYIRLRSKKLNKEVLPRLTCAHNYSNGSLPVYHFLCSLQTQGLRGGIGFTWGALLESKPFLPRVRYGNVIFSPAQWNISPSDIKEIPKITDSSFFEKVQNFKTLKKLPDKVLLVQGDNKLLIDLNHLLSVQMLFSEVKRNGFRLEEFLFENEYPLVKRGDEIFTNQVILCFHRNK